MLTAAEAAALASDKKADADNMLQMMDIVGVSACLRLACTDDDLSGQEVRDIGKFACSLLRLR